VLVCVCVVSVGGQALTDAGGPVGGEPVPRVTDAVETAEQVDAVAVSTDAGHFTTLVHVYTHTHTHTHTHIETSHRSFAVSGPVTWNRLPVALRSSDVTEETFRRHTHTFNGPFSGTTQVSRYQKGKTTLDFTEASDSE